MANHIAEVGEDFREVQGVKIIEQQKKRQRGRTGVVQVLP